MKYKKIDFSQLSNLAIKKLNRLPKKYTCAKILYAHLNLLENKLCGKEKDYFFHTRKQLSEEIGYSIRHISRAINQLKELYFIETYQIFPFKRKRKKHITVFKIL